MTSRIFFTISRLHARQESRAVASMYSWGGGGVGKKFPNVEKNFRKFHGIRSHEGVCYPENEDAINLQTKIRIVYAQTYYRSMQCRKKLFLMERPRTRAEGPRKFLNSEMPFPGLWGKF